MARTQSKKSEEERYEASFTEDDGAVAPENKQRTFRVLREKKKNAQTEDRNAEITQEETKKDEAIKTEKPKGKRKHKNKKKKKTKSKKNTSKDLKKLDDSREREDSKSTKHKEAIENKKKEDDAGADKKEPPQDAVTVGAQDGPTAAKKRKKSFHATLVTLHVSVLLIGAIVAGLYWHDRLRMVSNAASLQYLISTHVQNENSDTGAENLGTSVSDVLSDGGGEEQPQASSAPQEFDTTEWKTYVSRNYYFTLRYPAQWNDPVLIPNTDPYTQHSAKLFFEKPSQDSAMPAGFEVIIYSDRAYDLRDTKPLRQKRFSAGGVPECEGFVQEANIGPGKNFPASLVSIQPNHECYDEAYFHSVSRIGYIYNFVPVPEGGYQKVGYNGVHVVARDVPEYYTILETITFQDPPPPVPKPKAAKFVNGRYVCRGGDPTRWSTVNEPGHLDHQCCLDPDETPNPWCSYSAENLAKVRAMQAEGPPDEWEDKWE